MSDAGGLQAVCECSGCDRGTRKSGLLEPFLNVRKMCNEARDGFITLLESNRLGLVPEIFFNSTSVTRSQLFFFGTKKELWQTSSSPSSLRAPTEL